MLEVDFLRLQYILHTIVEKGKCQGLWLFCAKLVFKSKRCFIEKKGTGLESACLRERFLMEVYL